MPALLEALYTQPIAMVAAWILLSNIAAFYATLILGHVMVSLNQRKPTTPPAPPITWVELNLAGSCVVINAAVTFLGIILWRAGIVHVRTELDWRVALDVLALFLGMDFAMYVLHRVAHHPLFFQLIHATHHRYDHPRPLTLFVLNPLETLSFGLLWVIVIAIYPASWLGIAIYLTLNLAFGLMGHLGVEPLPSSWLSLPVLRLISTSTFHSEHHQEKGYNFGFYTLIWDHIFGTLAPEYQQEFAAITTPEKTLVPME